VIKKDILRYVEENTSPESPLLQKIRRETHLQSAHPQMLSGPIQGKLLELISKIISPRFILEVGTFTGYSAICLAAGLREDGKLHTIDINPEMSAWAESYFREAGMADKIVVHTGDALDIITGLEITFDLVFLDAAKESYLDYYHISFEKVNAGGIIIADNVLWDGKVLLEKGRRDRETDGIVRFNECIKDDDRVEQVMLPVRDGLSVIRKK